MTVDKRSPGGTMRTVSRLLLTLRPPGPAQIMDGSPSRGETIPIRLFLGGFDLTPTFRDVNKKFSTRYYLSLVLIDEGEPTAAAENADCRGPCMLTNFWQMPGGILNNPRSYYTARPPSSPTGARTDYQRRPRTE